MRVYPMCLFERWSELLWMRACSMFSVGSHLYLRRVPDPISISCGLVTSLHCSEGKTVAYSTLKIVVISSVPKTLPSYYQHISSLSQIPNFTYWLWHFILRNFNNFMSNGFAQSLWQHRVSDSNLDFLFNITPQMITSELQIYPGAKLRNIFQCIVEHSKGRCRKAKGMLPINHSTVSNDQNEMPA